MDQRDWRAPIALARNTPVAQTPHDLFVAEVFGFEIGGYRIDRLPVLKAVVFARIDTDAVFLVGIRFLPRIGAEGFAFDCDDWRNRQPVNLGEMKIPLIVRRYAHHRAVAVAHQHVVADPDLDLGTGQRMIDVDAGGHTFLFHRRHVGFDDAAVFAFVNEGDRIRIDVPTKALDVLVDAAEMEKRKVGWKPNPPRYTTGVLAKFAKLVQGAETGAITNPTA